MAEYNSVPLGQAGTGAAFSLGDNEALNRYFQNKDYNTQVVRQNALLAEKNKQEQQKQLDDSYIKTALKVKSGQYWRDIDDRVKNVFESRKSLYMRGINPDLPYSGNDANIKQEVEDYQLGRMQVESESERRDQMQPSIVKELTSFDRNKHTEASYKDLNNYANDTFENSLKRPMPTLQLKLQPNLTLDKVKLGKVGEEYVIGNQRIKKEGLDSKTARTSIVDAFKNENGINEFLQEDLGIEGFSVDALEKLPNTYEGIKESSVKEYSGNPEFRTQVAKQLGITTLEQFDKVASEKAIKAYDAKQKWEGFINSATKNKLTELGSSSSVLPDNTAEKMDMARQRLELAKDKADGFNSSDSPIDIELPYNKGNAKTIAEGYVPLSISKKNFAGIEAIDLKTGKPVPALKSSNDYEIVGVGNFPIIKDGNYAGSLSQPEYASGRGKDNIVKKPFIQVQQNVQGITRDFLVPYSKLPENVKNSKSVREALANFKPSSQSSNSNSLKKGQEKKVQGGIAVFNGSKWVMKE